MTHSLFEDDARRLVVVSYQNGAFEPSAFDRKALKGVISLWKIVPIQLAGYHFCFDDIRYRMVWGLATIYLGKETRLRSRDHEGSHVECRYGLMSYGIPVSRLPLSIDGVEEHESLENWIEERKAVESNDEDETGSQL